MKKREINRNELRMNLYFYLKKGNTIEQFLIQKALICILNGYIYKLEVLSVACGLDTVFILTNAKSNQLPTLANVL